MWKWAEQRTEMFGGNIQNGNGTAYNKHFIHFDLIWYIVLMLLILMYCNVYQCAMYSVYQCMYYVYQCTLILGTLS